MSLEKKFGLDNISDTGDLLYLEMNNGAEIMGRYYGRFVGARKKDGFYLDGVVTHPSRSGRMKVDGKVYSFNLLTGDVRRATFLDERAIAQLVAVSKKK